MLNLRSIRYTNGPGEFRRIVHFPKTYKTVKHFVNTSRILQAVFVYADSDGVTITRRNTSRVNGFACWEFVCIPAKNPRRVADRIRQMLCIAEYRISGYYECADI